MLQTVPHTPLYSTSTLPVLALLPPERRTESVALPGNGRIGGEGRREGEEGTEEGGEDEREEGGEEEREEGGGGR